MTNATLNLSVVEKRMLKKAEAASYCGLPVKHFDASCSVQPVEMRPNDYRWDKRDLDQWIDALKEGSEMQTQEAILGKLA